jgi:hypothetical protein
MRSGLVSPMTCCHKKRDDPRAKIVQSTYPGLKNNCFNQRFLEESAILWTTNENVKEIIMDQIQGETVSYINHDSVSKSMPYNLRNGNALSNIVPQHIKSP